MHSASIAASTRDWRPRYVLFRQRRRSPDCNGHAFSPRTRRAPRLTPLPLLHVVPHPISDTHLPTSVRIARCGAAQQRQRFAELQRRLTDLELDNGRLKSESAQLRAELNKLQSDNHNVRFSMSSVQNENNALKQENAELRSGWGDLQREYEALKQEDVGQRHHIQVLEHEKGQAEAEIAQLQMDRKTLSDNVMEHKAALEEERDVVARMSRDMGDLRNALRHAEEQLRQVERVGRDASSLRGRVLELNRQDGPAYFSPGPPLPAHRAPTGPIPNGADPAELARRRSMGAPVGPPPMGGGPPGPGMHPADIARRQSMGTPQAQQARSMVPQTPAGPYMAPANVRQNLNLQY